MSMSSSNPSNYRVKINQHSGEGELGIGIDLEQVDVDPTISSNPSNIIDAATSVHTMEVEAETDEECDGDDASIYNYNSFDCFAILSHKAVFLLAVVALLGMGVTVGFGVSGVVEHSHIEQQQQNAVPPIAIAKSSAKAGKSAPTYSRSGGKAGKSAPICLSDHDPIDEEKEFCEENMVIACGATFTNEKVVLSHDLFCTESVLYDATDEELMELNAAITLSGPDASIDCKGHTIRQISNGPGSFCQVGLGIGDPFEPSNDRKEMKKICYNFYQAGILLTDGAKAINCRVERFHDGFLVLNGGDVEKSEASGNVYGVYVRDLTGSIETTVSDVNLHDNADGILVFNGANANAVMIEGVTSKLSSIGMSLKGPDITVKDSTTSHNFLVGIVFSGAFEFVEEKYTTKIQLGGKISSHHNEYGIDFAFLEIDFEDFGNPYTAIVDVKGEVNTYLNRREGLRISTNPFYNVSFTVEESGTWISCQNTDTDIVNADGVIDFIDEGTDGYVCDSSVAEWSGEGTPTCVACPACI